MSIHSSSLPEERGDKLTVYLEALRAGREEMLDVVYQEREDVIAYAEGAWLHFYFLNA